jgi:hypothetical protein
MSIPQNEEEIPELIGEFQKWLMEKRPKGGDVFELGGIIMSILAQMRSIMKFEELHAAMHNMLLMVEKTLRTVGTMIDPEGNTVPVILAEQWRDDDNGKELYEWLRNPTVPDEVPNDWAT